MKINLAVYTAVNGYDWQTGTPAYSTADLVRYKGGIGKLPNPPMDVVPYGGVFNDNDTIVFYRMHMAIKSDANRRDSLYIVLGTLKKNEIGKIDFKCPFNMPEFAKPQKTAPIQVIYTGPNAEGEPLDYSVSFKETKVGEEMLSAIGICFAKMPVEGNLSMRITVANDKTATAIQYEAPPPPPLLPPPSPIEKQTDTSS